MHQSRPEEANLDAETFVRNTSSLGARRIQKQAKPFIISVSAASAHVSGRPAISFRGQSVRNESINSKAPKSQIH